MATYIRRQNRDGSVTWQAKIRRRGWPTKTRSFDLKGEAEDWAEGVERDQRRGRNVDLRAAGKFTFSDALTRYENEVSAKKRSHKNEVKIIRTLKASALADRTLANLSPSDVARWRDGRLAGGLSPYTVRNEMALISHLFTVSCQEWGFDGLPNPVRSVKRPKPPEGRDRRLRPSAGKKKGEQELLLEKAGSVHQSLGDGILFALETAMRVGELTKLRPSDINLDTCIAHLKTTKNGTARDVPLSTGAVKIVKKRLKQQKKGENKLLFGLGQMRMSHYFSQLAELCGFGDLRFHDLRHEATSRLFERGLNPMQVAAITGHKTLSQLKRYTHLRAQDLVKLLG